MAWKKSSPNKRKRRSTSSFEYPDVFPLGTKVEKYFGSVTLEDGTQTLADYYQGEITAAKKNEDGDYLYRVVYTDGDTEDMERGEVIVAVQSFHHRKKQQGGKGKLSAKEKEKRGHKVPPIVSEDTSSANDDAMEHNEDEDDEAMVVEESFKTPKVARSTRRSSTRPSYKETSSLESDWEEEPVSKKARNTSNRASSANREARYSHIKQNNDENEESLQTEEDDDDRKPVSKRPKREAPKKQKESINKPKTRPPSKKKAYLDDEFDYKDTLGDSQCEDEDEEVELDADEMEEELDGSEDEDVGKKPARKRGSSKKDAFKQGKKQSSFATPTWTPPPADFQFNGPSIYDYECQIPTEAEKEILEAAKTSQVQALVHRQEVASNTLESRRSSEEAKGDTSINKNRHHIKNLYTAGQGLAVLSDPQDMFDDMVQHLIELENPFRSSKDSPAKVSSKKAQIQNCRKLLLPLLKTLVKRPLKVATMCSGTESPLLALDMLQKSLRDLVANLGLDQELLEDEADDELFQIEHIFSCEIEPFKQAYIERNFQPHLLFRDIRELGQDEAYTAYGALAKVPNTPGDVDVLIAGTSCVDYSNLNTRKKNIHEKGESGQTFWGMVDWIEKTRPPIVIIENVSGAPWDTKVKIFRNLGYTADYRRLDTKDYYIPHTRSRGYLFAVSNGDCEQPKKWQSLLANLKRPASASLDAFMLNNDDPRVLRGRARLTAESCAADEGDRAGRTDWTRCETRHQYARSSEELGEMRPLTGWSESGNTVMPPFAWNQWVNVQVHRVHDLIDINTLRMAQVFMDPTYKTQVWNVSQNVDRDTMGKLGLCQCLTPSGVPYVTNRGGPLVGEELLMLQGIPAKNLLFTKESEANLKDLAGNAMSTTVVGAVTLAALILGHGALGPGTGKITGKAGRTLVPRPLQQPSEVSIERILDQYQQERVDLGPRKIENWKQFLQDAWWSSRKCYSEGAHESIPVDSLLVCSDCGETCSKENASPPRRYEEHSFEPFSDVSVERKQPSTFKQELLKYLPMIVSVQGFDLNRIEKPEGMPVSFWKEWSNFVQKSVSSDDRDSFSFRFTKLERSRVWIAHYECDASGARIEVRFHCSAQSGVTWFLFTKVPLDQGDLRTWLEKPVARLRVACLEEGHPHLITQGHWELRLPMMRECRVSFKGSGEKVDSWRNRMGLKGKFESEEQFEKLDVIVDQPVGKDIANRINGTYRVLPKCGAACGSLMKREGAGQTMFLFLESGRNTLAELDRYVFATTCHRTSSNEHRETELIVGKEFTPLFTDALGEYSANAEVTTPGLWLALAKSSLCTKPCRGWPASTDVTVPVGNPNLRVNLREGGWKVCPEIVACTVPITASNKLLGPCLTKDCLEVNMSKSISVLESLAFITSRLSIPKSLCLGESDWVSISRRDVNLDSYGDDAPCDRCAPKRPHTQWMVVEKGKQRQYLPMEDGREAAVYEQQLKNRPAAWVVRLVGCQMPATKSLRIGCNANSLVQRAYGNFPRDSLARSAALEFGSSKECTYSFRVVPHVDHTKLQFPRLEFSSNKSDPEAKQPPHFKYKLRKEQLRSLDWMLRQEASTDPFYEQEVTEEILSGLDWRAEGRVQRPVLVRGGIIADEVGYGKTVITLGLIDAAGSVEPTPPKGLSQKLITTKATLVIVPGHLMGQWPDEVKKFLGDTKQVVVIQDLKSLNATTVRMICNADIVVVAFKVLCNESYYRRLARLVGINPDSFPVGKKGGRLFDMVYDQCLSNLPDRVNLIKTRCSSVFAEIQRDAKAAIDGGLTARVCLDGKKAIYCGNPVAKGKLTKNPLSKDEHNPWNFSAKVDDYKSLKSPPLEGFFWNRIVVDEFTYLVEEDRERVLTLLLGLKSSYRWNLSGTPQHSNFNDIKVLGTLLGVHLGIDELLPGTKINQGRGKQNLVAERTGLENLSLFLEVRSMQWHERRHRLAQAFLDRFVRQNVAEIEDIPSEEHQYRFNQPAAERAIYLELETYLRSQDMCAGKAKRSKKKSTSDRDSRLQKSLRESATAEEALIKGCSFYDMEGESSTAVEEMQRIIEVRKVEMKRLERTIIEAVASCFRQHHRILYLQPDWNEARKLEDGECPSALNAYLTEVEQERSVSHGADAEVHARLKTLSLLAEAAFRANPNQYDEVFGKANDEIIDENSQPLLKNFGLEELYAPKRELHNYMHSIRAMGKELCGRIRSLRFVESAKCLQETQATTWVVCPKCNKGGLGADSVGILTCCGHVGCLRCLESCAGEGRCVAYPNCSADVSPSHVVSSRRFNQGMAVDTGSKYGVKMTAIVKKVKQIIDTGDRVIVFSQFDDLGDKVIEALEDSDVAVARLKGAVRTMVNELAKFQKEKPAAEDPRVLLLKMDDEQSAGLNLTSLNHAVFVHPLLAWSQKEYDAYETQAIGRIRRYGQTKTVHVHRFLVEDTIDTEIFNERGGRMLNQTTGIV